MNTGSFILKNALRNKRRLTLSVFSVAVSLFLLITLLVALREMTVPPEDVGAALRVVVRSKISIANALPARQRPKIERIPGIEAVSPFSWFGGKFRNEEHMTFAQFAMDAQLLTNIFGELKVPADQYHNFVADMRSCLLGKLTAEKYNLKVGDRIPFTSIIYPCTLEFSIAGIYQGTPDDRNMLFHHKYLEESCGSLGEVGTWWVKVRSIEEMPQVIDTINKTFANTAAEVRAESERAFQLSFISMWGNIKLLVGLICGAVMLSLLVVTASTMIMAIRERFRELAVLKALGFRGRELCGFILAESFGLAMSGALIAIGSAWLLFMELHVMQKVTQGILISFEVTPKIIGIAASAAAGLGILASIVPAILAARTTVVKGMKTLD